MRSCRMQGRVIRDTWRLPRCSFAPSYDLREATARRRWKTRTPSWVLPGRRRIPRCSFRRSRFTVTYSSPPITRADAGGLLDELIERRQAFPSGLVSHWVIPFVVVLKALGRAQQLEEIARNATISTRWLEAGLAYASDAFSEAADTLGEMGSRPDEAFVRLRAAEALVEAGRRAEANVQLERALAFYRSVGATAYVREAEALFAASA